MCLYRHPRLINTCIRAKVGGGGALRNAKEHVLHVTLLLFESINAMQLPLLSRLLIRLDLLLNSVARYVEQVKAAELGRINLSDTLEHAASRGQPQL